MLPGPPRKVRCPHCGKPKYLFSLMSGNTFGATFWSDGKTDAPMLPEVSVIQECEGCGKFYFTDNQEYENVWRIGHDEDTKMSLRHCRKALVQFADEELSRQQSFHLFLYTIHAYNDEFFRTDTQAVPTEEERELFEDCVRKCLTVLPDDIDPLVVADLHREIGEFDECLKILEAYQAPNPRIDAAKWMIMGRAKRHDAKVCIV